MRILSRKVLILILIGTLSLTLFGANYYLRVAALDEPPRWRNQNQNALMIQKGGYISLQAEAMDDGSLEKAFLSTNETGTWRNETEYAFLWKQDLVHGFDNFGTATYEDGVLYAPSKGNHVSDGKVLAVNASNGNIIWNVTARMVDGSPLIDGNYVFVGEGFSVIPGESVPNPRIMALNKTDGNEIWNFTEPQGNGWVGSAVTHEDYLYLTTGYYSYSTGARTGSGVYALNKTDGQEIWQTDIGFIVCSVAYHEGVVFVSGSDDAHPQGQYALNATNGDVIWHQNYGPSWDSSPVIYNGTIIQVVLDVWDYPYVRDTCVLNETNGLLIRRFEGKGSPSTPLVHDGRIFIPDDDWKLWAFNLQTGEEVWHTEDLHNGTLQNNSYCSPAAAGGAIYYQSLNGTFYVINETDGAIIWSFPLEGYGIGSLSIGDGCVYVTNDAALYTFKIGPGSGAWPMFCQTPSHISNSQHGIEYVRRPLTQPKHLNSSDEWTMATFVWCNSTIDSAAIAWRIYFSDGAENTNVTDLEIFYVNKQFHNIAIVALSSEKKVIELNQTMSISLTVVNGGNYTETFNLTTYLNTTIIQTQMVSNLANGSSIMIAFTLNTSGLSVGAYTLNAYAEPVESETYTSDNIFINGAVRIVKILGDVNGDGIVELMDFFIASQAFGSSEGDPNWNPDADINGDGFIELTDFFIMSQHFGET